MISFSSSVGNLFNALGRMGKLVSQAGSYQSAQNTNFTGNNEAIEQLALQSDIQAIFGSAWQGNINSIGSATGQLTLNAAQQWINRVVFDDNPQPGQTRTTVALQTAIVEIIRQMKVAGATVLTQVVTGSATSFTGTGNGIVVVSLNRPQDGLTQELAFAENIQILCTADSYLGGQTAGNEGFTANGEGNQNNAFAFDWPIGSGATAGLNAVNGNSDNSAGNFLTNSGFTDWTSNVPDNWTLDIGTAGTDIAQETTIVYDNTGSSLRIIGDGSTLTTLSQTFNVSTGTTGELEELTQYAINLFVRRDGTAPAAGELTVELVDGNGDVIDDEDGTANSFTIDLTALSTSFASYTGTFRTPAVLPDTQKIRLRLSTALTNGRNVYVDRMAFAQMVRLYAGGPYLSIFSGSSNFVQGDFATTTITNARGGGGSLDSFQTLMGRWFPSIMLGSELLLPSSSSPSVSDSLITN